MSEPYSLPIHFDNFQGKHEINSDTLFVFVGAYKDIAEVYGLHLDVQICVLKEGGWKSNLIFLVTFVGFNPFVALLTGETADDWAKKGHVHVVKKINEFLTLKASELPEEFPKECVKQKNRMYEQFQKDNCVDTFHLGDFPPIARSDFYLYIKDLKDDEYVYLGEAEITVYSPDWKGKRSWKGKINLVDEYASSFAFDKDLTGKFWEMVRLDNLSLHTTDVMRVQLIRRPTYKVKYLVIRVLSYNDQIVDAAIPDEAIGKFAIFAKPDRPTTVLRQGLLFE